VNLRTLPPPPPLKASLGAFRVRIIATNTSSKRKFHELNSLDILSPFLEDCQEPNSLCERNPDYTYQEFVNYIQPTRVCMKFIDVGPAAGTTDTIQAHYTHSLLL